VTRRRYLEDPYLDSCDAKVTAVDNGWLCLSDTIAYPGGGGQPADRLSLVAFGAECLVSDSKVDAKGDVWLLVDDDIPRGAFVTCRIDWAFRYALMRHHALMHIVNTLAAQRYQGMQTGTQLGPERSRVDFRFPEFDRTWLPEFETAVNDVIARDLPISSALVSERELRTQPELIRTKNVKPPVEDGYVRVVEIHGFDAQACGGTHVHSTHEIGHAEVAGYENKGAENKRIYWVLAD
jgi:misacylated tRNA(Ala) deacylase